MDYVPALGFVYGRIADVAQLVELLICNQVVAGSSPAVGSLIIILI